MFSNKSSNNTTSSTPSSNKRPLLDEVGEPLGTAFVYDVRCSLHKNVIGEPDHVESPERILRIYEILKRNNLIEKMHRIKSRPIRSSEILMLHTQKHHDIIKKTKDMSERQLQECSEEFGSIYFSNDTDFSARLAAGSVCELIEHVLLKIHKNGIAIVRPPGHHAEPEEPMGFCIYNNIAISIKALKLFYYIEKIVIIDWDIHLGNGIQSAFINDPSVVYLSIHRYDKQNFYPQTARGSPVYIGGPKAKGSTINIGWDQMGKGDSDYVYAFKEIVIPVIKEANPTLVIVASGFDAAEGDMIGKCKVTPRGYKTMTKMLKQIAGDRLVLCLEGGYNLDSISVSALACTRALLEDTKDYEFEEPESDTKFTINEVKYALSNYWKCFKNAENPYGDANPINSKENIQ